eukprot:TRINITY_DN17707_c0_g1_i6.p1 TRINITY_DN17707_c0_g1~~TRINITY_DN17707_c0_g1_i6.p1  ORF type:complete len:305 (+),score=59.95 TRINITY_DN17707_c0_g1_i6:220-1134(+)
MGDQLDALLSDFRNATVSANRDAVDLPAEQMDGTQIDFRIEMDRDFPGTAPTVRLITPGMQHPWIDEAQFVIGCTSLLNWAPGKTTLTEIVSEIVEEFFLNPPTRQQQVRAHTRPPPSFAETMRTSGNSAMDELLAELRELPPSELERLSMDETHVELQKYLHKHPTFQQKQSQRSNLQTEVEGLTQARQSHQDALSAKRKEYLEAYHSYKILHETVTEKGRLQQSRAQENSPEAVHARLSGLADAAENQSEDILQQFQGKQMDMQSFINQYRQSRLEFHRVAILQERIKASEQLQQRLSLIHI